MNEYVMLCLKTITKLWTRVAIVPSIAELFIHSIPFHFIVLFQATRPIQTKHRLYKKTENQYKAQKTYKHIYTTRSNFTKALLLAL